MVSFEPLEQFGHSFFCESSFIGAPDPQTIGHYSCVTRALLGHAWALLGHARTFLGHARAFLGHARALIGHARAC